MKHHITKPRVLKQKSCISDLFRTFHTDPLVALREQWSALRHEEDTSPVWQRESLARRRTSLLDGYPERDIPGIIDILNANTEEIAHA